jgi:hypothetical protein
MDVLRYFAFVFLMAVYGCSHDEDAASAAIRTKSAQIQGPTSIRYDERAGKGALLLTRFVSLEEFKEAVQVRYADDLPGSEGRASKVPQVHLTYVSGGREITSILKSGISQGDFNKVRNSTLWKKMLLGLRCPYALTHQKDLTAIEHLGRRRPPLFGKGDAAFYDLAEAMVSHIRAEDRPDMSCEDLAEKGYLNTFNHITAQAFMTSIFSERLADFVADVHELYNMPELITGKFTEAHLSDFVNGPVDNYVDMINNEWGQELGKELKVKYHLSRKTYWTPELLADVLNEIQRYHSWAFQIGFHPFRATDEMVVQFAWKINKVNAGL